MEQTAGLPLPVRDTSPKRPRRAEHQEREARVKFWRVVIVTSFFALLIGGSLLVGAVAMIGSRQSQSRAEAAAKHATAKISRPMLDGVFCHYLVFDNNSGQSIEDKVERCDKDSVAAATKRPGQTQFVWGGR
jgi:hypothetical protein